MTTNPPTPVATVTLARCEEHPESPWANYRLLSDRMRDALDKLAHPDNTRECLCGAQIGADFRDDDIDGVAVGRIDWHTAVLIQRGEKVAAVCEACDPDPDAFATKDLIIEADA